MFSTYDQWKLRSPDDEAAYRLGYDPCDLAEDEDVWLWLDSLENPQPIDEDDLDEIPAHGPEDYETIVSVREAA